jgi:hypothetical protein
MAFPLSLVKVIGGTLWYRPPHPLLQPPGYLFSSCPGDWFVAEAR